ncbi:salicylate hydroxylase [Pseudomonas oryzihabitans]|uniref:salicylate 1-monooxygenase n=1 Tax=Pseudomonas rhizoryzae TaxID=2571129 RepID=UPI000736D79C|nr:salicylate 1-monooxygenase [Pseudomonas rhizoryzae]KTT35585.1 salicylate hydroxylase [Pseudomonas psychrotolerans]KTT45744.1 salicylate hydroxylase [Pseudomonas psychrotolerans]KTT71731.1 salicylate hydroxylase [Pseudomonas psychrotolerans]
MNAPLNVAIVGGGIAGVGLALGLKDAPHLKVTLFESAPAFGEIGAGVSFGANAVRALAGLGMAEPYQALADRTPDPWQDVWFEWRRGSDAGYLGATLAPGVGQSSIHRADFLDALARRLPEGMAVFGKRACGLQQDASGATLSFTDGTTHACDLVLAADGIKSGLRAPVLAGHGLSDPGPRFTGSVAYRGLVERELLRERFRAAGLDQHLLDVPQMYLAQDGHILTFPIKQGRIINIVAFLTAQPRTAVWPADQPWVRNASRAEVGAAFADWGLAARTLVDAIDAPTLWALHDLEELPYYVHGRAALLGDAAHAMLPHQGAGAGQGLEDAWFLRELLVDPQLTRGNLEPVLQAYQRWRLPRACRTQRTSWEAGELYEYRDRAIGRDEALLGQTLARRFDWLWQHDLLDDVRAARRSLGWTLQPA